jgi:hypothetical protein
VIPLSEAETRSRERSALDRDEASREGGIQPPSKAESRSWVVRPSSETEPHPKERLALEAKLYWGGAVPLKRSGVSPEDGWAVFLVGCGFVLRVRLGLFAFVFYEFKRVSPGCLGDPHGCPRQ